MLQEKTTYQDDFPINIRIVKVVDYPIHYHQDIEFVFVIKGKVRLKNFCTQNTLKEGDVFTNSGHEVHGITAIDKDNTVAIIQISNQFFTQYFPQLNKACFMTGVDNNNNANLDKLRRMLLNILLEYSKKSINYKQICISQMIEIIKYLNQFFNLFAFRGQDVVNFNNDNPIVVERISHIINYVYENYQNRISLQDLADREHLSSYYVSHLIHEHMGISFQNFLCFARVEMSEIHLLDTNHKVNVIARDVGFSTTSYYEKYFTKWFGHSPQAHRGFFSSHVLSTDKPAVLESLSEAQAVHLLKLCLSSICSQENSTSVKNYLHLSIDVDQDAHPIMKVEHSLEIMITQDDYNLLQDILFSSLQPLKISRIAILIRQGDYDSNINLIINRLVHYGYDVVKVWETAPTRYACFGYDSIAYVVHILSTYFNAKKQVLRCYLRDPGTPQTILKGCAACFTSCLVPKPSYYMFRLLQNINGEILHWGKYYYVIRDSCNGVETYAVIVANYNDNIAQLCMRNSTQFETNDIINSFIDELIIDFSLDVDSGKYIISKYVLNNHNSVFKYMADLGFPEKALLKDTWLKLLNTEPQTQVWIENVEDKLDITSAIAGVGVNVYVIEKIST